MNVSGKYKLTLKTPVGSQQGALTLPADGETLNGSLTNALGGSEFKGGSVRGNTVEFDTKVPTPLGRLKARVTGKVDGDHFSGDAKLPLGTAHIEGKRIH